MKHPFLQSYLDEGVLDFACYYHAEHRPNLHLLSSDETLTPENVRNPIVVIGNYFFDTIPQDLFLVRGGKLLEGRVRLSMDKTAATEALAPTDPTVIRHLNYDFDYVPIDNFDSYYPDFPELNKILKIYASRFENIPFQFPVGAFQTIRFFRELSKGRMLLLAGDQGRCTESQMQHFEPFIAKHSSFSLSVNYHAISMFFRHEGGMSVLTTYPEPLFVVVAAALGGDKESYPETTLAFRTHIDYFEPNDYLRIVQSSEKEWLEPTLQSILLILKLGDWDPVNFNAFFSRIRQALPSATIEEKERLVQVVYNIWDRFYPVSPEEGSFVMNLGVLLFDLGHYAEAIAFFKRALELNYESELVYNNLTASYYALKDLASAQEWQQKSQEFKLKAKH
jgi:Tetratricopeptide repeat